LGQGPQAGSVLLLERDAHRCERLKTMEDELDPNFADMFEPGRRPPCQLYLISPLEIGGDFPARLDEALAAGPVAAFQFRVKGQDQHEAARLAAPLLDICRARDVAFIVNDDMGLAKRLGAGRCPSRPGRRRPARCPRAARPGSADRSHLPRQPPPRHGSGEAGADYVAFGAFYPTATKDTEHRRSPRSSAGGRACSRSLCRDRRHHARKCRDAGRRGGGFHRRVQRGLEPSGGPAAAVAPSTRSWSASAAPGGPWTSASGRRGWRGRRCRC
jgi:hypothetical protein